MARLSLILFALLIVRLSPAQEDPLAAFDQLLDKTWLLEGSWGNAMAFKQETTFRKNLEGQLIIAESKGYIDQEQTQWGDRNHGIRRYDAEEKKLKFYEYDVFGGLTEGEIKVEGKDFLYIYRYEGQMICDKWEYVSDTEYRYLVGTYKNGQLDMILLDGQATLKKD